MSVKYFDGRPWCALTRVTGDEMDEVFQWAQENDIDCLCQGIMQGTLDDPENTTWHSIWSFGNKDELLLFALRFASVQSNS